MSALPASSYVREVVEVPAGRYGRSYDRWAVEVSGFVGLLGPYGERVQLLAGDRALVLTADYVKVRRRTLGNRFYLPAELEGER
jgi:hypothetical protein